MKCRGTAFHSTLTLEGTKCVYEVLMLMGMAGGVGTHVTVFVCLMCGEYDDNLTWPFRGAHHNPASQSEDG